MHPKMGRIESVGQFVGGNGTADVTGRAKVSQGSASLIPIALLRRHETSKGGSRVCFDCLRHKVSVNRVDVV